MKLRAVRLLLLGAIAMTVACSDANDTPGTAPTEQALAKPSARSPRPRVRPRGRRDDPFYGGGEKRSLLKSDVAALRALYASKRLP